MNTKKTFVTIGALALIVLCGFSLAPSYSQARRNVFGSRADISVGPYKSDTVRVSESYERILGSFIVIMDNRLAVTDQGLEKVSEKLDSIEKKIDKLDTRLKRIEKALNTPEDIPKPDPAP